MLPTRGRPLAALTTSVVLLGLADSLVGAYFVLYLADIHLSPTQIGLLFSLPSVGGIALSFWCGRRFNRRPTRTWAVAATLSSAAGYALFTTTTSFLTLLVISLVLLAAYQAIYPQLFSTARVVLGNDAAGRRAAPLLRAGWSVAWAVGPLLGALLLPRVGFTGVLWAAVVMLLLTVASLLLVPSLKGSRPELVAPDVHPQRATAVRRGQQTLLAVGVALFFLAMFAGSLALLFLAQVPRGVAIAVVAAAGIRYFQDVLTPATGFATTLFSAATDAGLVLSGVLGGVAVEGWGTAVTLGVCGVVALAGALSFGLARVRVA